MKCQATNVNGKECANNEMLPGFKYCLPHWKLRIKIKKKRRKK
jgi:hypothetical protein